MSRRGSYEYETPTSPPLPPKDEELSLPPTPPPPEPNTYIPLEESTFDKLKRSPVGIVLFAIFVAFPVQLWFALQSLLKTVNLYPAIPAPSSTSTDSSILQRWNHQLFNRLGLQKQNKKGYVHIQMHKGVDPVTGAMVNTLRWLIDHEQVTPLAVRRYLAFATNLQILVSRLVMGVKVRPVDIDLRVVGAGGSMRDSGRRKWWRGEEGRVRGHWIAESWEDVPMGDVEEGESLGCFKDYVVMMYFHGGGYMSNTSLSGSDYLAALIYHFNRLSRHHSPSPLRLVIFSLEYPLAPENPYPAQLNSALDAYEHLTHSFPSIQRLLVAGDSAGGNLSISFLNALQNLNETGTILKPPQSFLQPFGCIMYSPWVDPGCTSHPTDPLTGQPLEAVVPLKNNKKMGETKKGVYYHSQKVEEVVQTRDYVTPKLLRLLSECVIQGTEYTLTDPQISPYYLEPSEICVPDGGMLVVYGGVEVMVGSIRGFVEKAAVKAEREGKKIEVDEVEGMPHVFNMILLPFYYTGHKKTMGAVKRSAGFMLRALDRCGLDE
ncbi:hypothetical protein HDV05_005171 [Chytridiales sp. JEL 0842]|nr:hypothetical protein HDV05_005171 [Chytridiales sp. JEL 0842]